MTHSVSVTRRAVADIDNQYRYMADRSATSAIEWRERMQAAIESLALFPERCPLSPESEWFDPGLRELYVGKRRNIWRVLFVVRGGHVGVLRVRHARQDLLHPGDL